MNKILLIMLFLFSANIFANVIVVGSHLENNEIYIDYSNGRTTEKSKLQIREDYNLSFDYRTIGLMIENASGEWVKTLVELASNEKAYALKKPNYFFLVDGESQTHKLSKDEKDLLKLKSIPNEYPLSLKFEEVSGSTDDNSTILVVKIFYYNILGELKPLKEINTRVEYIPHPIETDLSFENDLGSTFLSNGKMYKCKSVFCKYEIPKLKLTNLRRFQLNSQYESADQFYTKNSAFPLGSNFLITTLDKKPVQEIELQGALLIKKSVLKKHNFLLLKNGEFYSPNIHEGFGTSLDDNEKIGRSLIGFSYISFERKLNPSLFETYLISKPVDGLYEVESDSDGRYNAYLLGDDWKKISDLPDFSLLQKSNAPIALFETEQPKSASELLDAIKMFESNTLLNSLTLDYSLFNSDIKNFFFYVLESKKKLRRIRIEKFAIVSELDEKILDLIVSNKNIREILISVDKLDSDWGIVLSQKMSDDRETPTDLKESFNVSYQKVLRTLLDHRGKEKHKEGNDHTGEFYFLRTEGQNHYSNSCFDVTKETKNDEIVYRITGDNGNVDFLIYPTDDVLGNDMFIRICLKNKELHFGMYAPKNSYAKRYENFPTGYFFGPTHFTNKQDFLNFASGAIATSIRTGSEYGLPK